jgi:cell division transport system permease protein
MLGRLPETTVLADIMMMFRNLRFALNSAWQSFWRNLAVSLAAVLSITLILILGGINLLVGHALSQVLDGFREKVSVISINVADGTPLANVSDFQTQLGGDSRVAGVRFITKDEALANFTKDPNNAVLAQQLDGNPLDAKLEVHVRSLTDVAAVDTLARQWPGVDPTNPTNYQGEFVNRMLQLSQWLGLAGVGLMAILVVVSVVIVMNTIRTAVYHRRKEIEVMKLVGATEWFVRGPFVIEGIMTGLIAASIALALLVIAYPPAVQQFRSDIAFIPLSYDPTFLTSLARDLLLGGALLGALGSYIGVRRFVRI